MASELEKIDRQRAAIQEHVYKYQLYLAQQDRDFACKTIRNCQGQIRDLKLRAGRAVPFRWEDDWEPGKPCTLDPKLKLKGLR